MNQSWEERTLGEICDNLDSKRIPVTKRDRQSGIYPYYGATGILDFVNSYIFDEKLVLIGEDGAKWGSGENTAFIVEGKYWVNNHAHVIRPDRLIVTDEWLVYYLNYCDLRIYTTGLTVPKLNQTKLNEIPIPLPPLPEQRRIVAILDETFAAIAKAKENTEKNLQNARDLLQSYLNSIFTSPGKDLPEKKFEDCLEKVIYTNKIQRKDFQKEGEFPIISQEQDFINGYWDNPSDLFVIKKPVVVFGDHTRIVKYVDFNFVLGADGVKILQPIESLFPKYFYYFLQGIEFENLGYARHYRLLKDYSVPLPPLPEQKRIVAKFDALSAETQKLEAVYRQKLTNLEELRQSLLRKAFEGEL